MDSPQDDVFERLSRAIDSLGTHFQETHDALAEQLASAQTHLSQAQGESGGGAPGEDALREELSKREGLIEELRGRIGALEQELEEVRRRNTVELEEARREMGQAKERVDQEAQGAREAAQQAAEEAQGEAIALRERLGAVELEVTQRDARIAELEQALEAGVSDQAGEAQIADLQAQLESAQSALAEAQEQVTRLEDDMADARDDADDAAQEAEEAKKRAAELEAQLEARSAENARWESESKQAWEQIAAMEKECEKARAAKSEAYGRCAEATARMQDLEDAAAELERKCREARDAENQALARQEEAEERVRSLEGEVAALKTPPPPPPPQEAAPPVTEKRGLRKRRIGDVLVEAGVLSAEQVAHVASEQASNPQRKFGSLVVELGFTTEEAVARVLATQLGIPFTALGDEDVDPKAVALVGASLARSHQCVPVWREEDALYVAMANPLDLIALEDIELATSLRAEPLVATAASIRFVIDRFSPGA